MSQTNMSKIMDGVLAQQKSKSGIINYKIFHKAYLSNIKNRQGILLELAELPVKFQKATPISPFLHDQERAKLLSHTETFLKQNLGDQVLSLFKKQTPIPETKRNYQNPTNNFIVELFLILSQTFEAVNEHGKQNWAYKTNFLTFLYNCLFHYGLHPDILTRNPQGFKRYNIILQNTFKSRGKIQTDYKTLLKPEALQAEFLTPYEKRLPIRINGKIIPAKDFYSIKITSTLLLDDEIELFAAKNKFDWTNKYKDELSFTKSCLDETEELQKNPYLIEQESLQFKNQGIYFIDQERIKELSEIKNKKFDLIKLIQLCKELNTVSSTKSYFASSAIVRAIIDHIPPIFEYKTFSEVANNYTGGTRSFKKSMLNLDNSLRNIADNNIHSQVRSKEVLPTKTQIDFSQELDLLLSEVVRVLK